MLIVFSGLPGTGKTTVARLLSTRLAATYLRVDNIEQALRDSGLAEVGKSGYAIANALARSNLALGQRVVVDCVNPVAESREAWRAIAESLGVGLLDIELLCSNRDEHRRRVQNRELDVPGLVPPTWQSVCEHDYQPWSVPPLRLDSARLLPEEAVQLILEQLGVRQ